MVEKKSDTPNGNRRGNTRSRGARSGKAAVAKASAEKVRDEDSEAQETDSGNGAFELGDSLTIREVEQLHQRLSETLERSGIQALGGGEIEAIDAAGLQLLAVLMREAETRGLELGWRAASETLCRAAWQTGLAELLRLADTEQAA